MIRTSPRWSCLLLLPLALGACSDSTAPATPAGIEVHGDGQEGVVGTTLAQPLGIRVLDGRGRPLPGATVSWSFVIGHGTLDPVSALTDADGRVQIRWTLGTAAGQPQVVARVQGSDLQGHFTATARPDAPAGLQLVSGDGQVGEREAVLPQALVVRVVDQYTNGVPDVEVHWTVASGGGSVSSATAVTDGDGRAQVTWTLGTTVGEQTVTVVAGSASRTFTATAAPSDFNIFIESVHLNQGSQRPDGSVGGVARRPGLLRVVVRATVANTFAPDVRVRLYIPDRGVVGEALIPAPRVGVPTDPDLRMETDTWNLALPADGVLADLHVVAEVDPDGRIPVLDRQDNRFPQGDTTASLDVRSLAPLRIVFIPIHSTRADRTGDIHIDNVETFLAATRRFIPSAQVTPILRQGFVTDQDLTTGSGWSGLLSDIQALRTAESATDEYYQGIVPAVQGSGIAGIGYVPSDPASPFRSGISFDRLPAATDVVAHELGHNLGRRHAPSPGCLTPANIDPDFPYHDGGIGWPGYDILTGDLRLPAGYRDYMGYCNTVWTSDYTYDGIVQWRRNDPLAGAAASAAETDGLLVWGTINASGVTLNPAFALSARPALPHRPGPYTLRGFAADGTELFALPFRGTSVPHAPDPEEAHFAFFVPLDATGIQAVTRVEVTGPRGRAAQARRTTGPLPDDILRLAPSPAGQRRLRWPPDRYPMALVRESATGRIVGMTRGGELVMPDAWLEDRRVDVILSDGVASRPVRLP
jgi:hypothetical protein